MSVCRTCLSKKNLQFIFASRHKYLNSSLLLEVTGMKIKCNDGLSQCICNDCLNLIKSAITLRTQSAKADSELRKIDILLGDVKAEPNCGILNFNFTSNIDFNLSDNDINGEYMVNCSLDDFLSDETKEIISRARKKKTDVNKDNDFGTNIQSEDKNKFSVANSINKPIHTENNDSDFNEQSNKPKYNEDFLSDSSTETQKTKLKKKLEKTHSTFNLDDLESSDSNNKVNVRIEDFESSDDSMGDTKMLLQFWDNESNQQKLNRLVPKSVIPKNYSLGNDKKMSLNHRSLLVGGARGSLAECCLCHSRVQPKNFRSHVLQRHFTPKFPCEHCDKRFHSRAHLRYHRQRAHGARKRLVCARCDYRAVDTYTIKNHERAEHTGERPYICDVCGQSFRMRNNIIQHLRRHFGVKNLQCERCPAMFKSNSELWGHRNKVHLKTFRYHCYLCPANYKGLKSVRKHVTNVHGIPPRQQLKIQLVKTPKTDAPTEDLLSSRINLDNFTHFE